MRRFVHDFLKWLPAAIGGGAIATAAVWTGAKDWIAFQAAWAWAQMSSPWVAFFALISVASYVAAIIWTGRERKPLDIKTDLKPPSRMNPSDLWFKRGMEDEIERQSLEATSNNHDFRLSLGV